jgi:hypothetical protein
VCTEANSVKGAEAADFDFGLDHHVHGGYG